MALGPAVFFPPSAVGRLTGEEDAFTVRSTNQNYYLATLAGESDYYDPTFYDDHLLSVGDQPVLHFTKVGEEISDFYYYPTETADLDVLQKLFEKHKSKLDRISTKIVPSLARYRSALNPSYASGGLYEAVTKVVEETTRTTPKQVIADDIAYSKIDPVIYQYLRSNGVADLSGIANRPGLVNMIVNKFFMLSTTYFYRDYPALKVIRDHLAPLKARAEAAKRPLKLKVYACSTGEEVITYAVELLEAGIRDFTILGSDINDSSLLFAAEMKYPYAAFSRLPLETQAKLKKYFHINRKLGLWEPLEPGFFKSRIRFIHQDILQPLPRDLEDRFAPPYDLVSIMNVLFYLEDDAVQKRKDYWANLLNPGGLLVLHDARYSLLMGRLGYEWAFKNFIVLNDWVNVKAGDVPYGKKMQAYEEAYRRTPSESNMILVTAACRMGGKPARATEILKEYLSNNPYSAAALNIAVDHFVQQGDIVEAKRILADPAFAQVHFSGTLKRYRDLEGNKKEKPFLEKLIENQRVFMKDYAHRPADMEKLFDFEEPASAKYGVLRLLMKVFSHSLLQRFYVINKIPNAPVERISLEGIRLAEELARTHPAHVTAAQYLSGLLRELLDFYIQEGFEGRALALADRGAAIAQRSYAGSNYFYVPEILGTAALAKAAVHEKQGSPDLLRAALGEALAAYERASALGVDLPPSKRSEFCGNYGRAWMLRGKSSLQAGEFESAEKDFMSALGEFEKALELNPLYGKETAERREELLSLLEALREKRRRAPIPTAGRRLLFSDAYGPYEYKTEVLRYKTEDGASIEATLVTPQTDRRRPGLVFVHMWARDRNTFWGLPEYLATYGYASIAMDLRGHGNSKFPGRDIKVTVKTVDVKYADCYRDVLPAIDILSHAPNVATDELVLIGASLGCPVGVLAAARRPESFIGMVHLSPAPSYFDVHAEEALEKVKNIPTYVFAEKTDKSYSGAKRFFSLLGDSKTLMEVERVGHGTDMLYADLGIPTLIHNWLEQLEQLKDLLQKVRGAPKAP